MKYSKLLIPTTREVPAEAEILSHRLMIRAGFIRKLASGTYTYLPLGLRSLQKITQIVREEMNAAGAQEIDMPYVQPMELWERTGRRAAYGETLGWFKDRHGRENVLAPTAEEVVTSLVAAEISSYKQLPLNLYQIKLKYRDEFRPRFGVLRSREFLMKDAYSFHATQQQLDEAYQGMYDAYRRICRRCGVPHVVVDAASGEIGGVGSQEFMVPCPSGEDIIVHTEDGAYAANIEKAEVDAVRKNNAKRQAQTDIPPLEEVHTPNAGSIDAVCKFLGTKPEEMVKTLIYHPAPTDKQIDQEIQEYRATHHGQVPPGPQSDETAVGGPPFIALVRGDHEINDDKLRAYAPSGHFEFASEGTIKWVTGAEVGFAGPQGLEKISRLVVDHAVAAMPCGATGANKTDYHVRNLVPGRDFPLEGDNVIVADIRNAVEGDTHGGKALRFTRGIEIGHIFKLGTKYSEKLGATFLDESGAEQPCIMGTYGIGINRILAAAIEAGNDENGCILPVNIAPFEVLVIPLNQDKPEVAATAGKLYDDLRAAGADVLLDDRPARPGVKFKDADLIGIPVRVVVGERGLKDGTLEVKRRTDEKPTAVKTDETLAAVMDILSRLRNETSETESQETGR